MVDAQRRVQARADQRPPDPRPDDRIAVIQHDVDRVGAVGIAAETGKLAIRPLTLALSPKGERE